MVSALKVRKIAQDELTASLAKQTVQLETDTFALRNLEEQIKSGAKYEDIFAETMDGASTKAKEYAIQTKGAAGSADVFVEKQKSVQAGLEATTKAANGTSKGMKVLSVAANIGAMLAASVVISAVSKGLDILINTQENAIEKAEEFINKFEEQRNSLSSNKETIDSIASDYEKLANGVDGLGRNTSLSTEEYARYNEIVNQIADMFPQMVQGYTDEGNAIIAHKGSVEELTKAYEEQKQAAQSALIIGSSDVFAGFKAKVDHNAAWGWEESGLLQLKKFGEQLSINLDDIDKLSSFYESARADNTLLLDDFLEYANINLGIHWNSDGYAKELQDNKEKILSVVHQLTTEIDTEAAKIKPVMNAFMEQSWDYQTLSEDTQDIIKQIVSQFNSEFYAQFDDENEMASWVTENVVNQFKGIDGTELSSEIDVMFGVQTQFNNGEITVSEYQDKLAAFLKVIEPLDDQTEKAIKLLFGIETFEDGTTSSSVDIMIANVQSKLQDEFDDKVGDLEIGDLKIASEKLELDPAVPISWDELTAKIKEYKASLGSTNEILSSDIFSLEDAEGELTNLGKISKSIDTIQNAYKTLDDAIDEYNENGSISIDTLQSVIGLGDNWLHYLVDAEGNLALNKEGLQKLTQSRLEDMRVQALNNLIDNVGKIEDDISANEYLISTNYALADSYEALAKQNLYNKLEKLKLDPDISDEMYAKIEAQALGDMEKINNLFNNTDFSADLSLGGGSGGSSTNDASEELIDFIERRIEVLNEANSLLETNLENVNGSFAKNTLIDSQLGIAEESFRNYTDSLSMYSELANAALSALPTDLAEKVKNGSLSITSEDSDLVELINEYDKWSDKVAECEQELAKLKENIRQLELDKFNNIIEDFTNQFDIYENANELIKKQISLFEEAGELIGESFYTTQLEEFQKQLNLLEKEKTTLVNQLNSALSSGRIQAGTDEWFEMINALSDVDGSILECKTSIEELDNAILDLHTEVFERIQNQFSSLNSELENLYGLFDEDAAVTDGNQNWTDAALAQLGLLAQQYELSQYQIQQYDKEIEQLNSDYINGKYSAIEYADKLADLSSAQWDAVNSSESIKDSIVDLNQTRIDEIVEGIEEEINAYQKLTNAQIDALDAEKELHDYEESIAEKTKSVTNLERQIAAMQNDTTAATVAKRLQLEEELAQAKKELENAEYEHSLESQKEALNQQYEDYETSRNEEIAGLEESLNDKEALIYNSFEAVKANSNIVGSQIAAIATQHGIRVSDSLISSWKSGENAIASYGFVLSQNSSAFIGNIMGIETEFWMLQNKANETSGTLSYMFSTQADTLISELEQSYDSEYNLANMTSALQSSLISTLEGSYDISNIVDALDIIAEKARAAAEETAKIGDDPDSSVVKNNETWKIVNAQTGTPVDNVSYSSSADALEKLKEYNKNGGGYTIKKYAAGTRNSNGGLIIKDEEGYELTLPKLSNGRYAIANEGTQILTKAQTDNIFDWSKENPNNYHTLSDTSNIFLKTIPLVIKRENDPPTMNYVVHVDGDVNNSNIKQIEAVVQDGLHKFATQINRDYRYGRK